MSKSTHFFGQPVYGQLTKRLDKDKIVEMSRKHGGERYVKRFNGWHHLLTMLYAVIMRFDLLVSGKQVFIVIFAYLISRQAPPYLGFNGCPLKI